MKLEKLVQKCFQWFSWFIFHKRYCSQEWVGSDKSSHWKKCFKKFMYEIAVFLLLHFEIKNYLIHFAVYTQTLKCTNWMRIFFFFFPLQIIAFCKIHILSIDCHSNQELTLFFPDLLFQGILYSVISRYPMILIRYW